MEKRKDQVGHFFLGIVVLTWGINFGVVKSAYQDLSPILFCSHKVYRFRNPGHSVDLLAGKRALDPKKRSPEGWDDWSHGDRALPDVLVSWA
jgi:hypothetical protein